MPTAATRIQKWGHSLAIRIPKALAAQASLDAGAHVALTKTRSGELTIKLVKRSKPTLKELVGKMNRRNRPPGVDFGPAVGKESL
jgi:antitoxin MazE